MVDDLENNIKFNLSYLEDYYRTPIIAIIYNPYSEGVSEEDIENFLSFINEVFTKENIKKCILILHGRGGFLTPALICSQLLRTNLNYYSVIVPYAAASALGYLALQSNKLIISKKTILTQMDPLLDELDERGEPLRAIKCRNHKNQAIREESRIIMANIEDRLSEFFCKKKNCILPKFAFNENGLRYSFLQKFIGIIMNGDNHHSQININELKNLGLNIVDGQSEIMEMCQGIVRNCEQKIENLKGRLLICTKDNIYDEFERISNMGNGEISVL